jgi:hypothetical protein
MGAPYLYPPIQQSFSKSKHAKFVCVNYKHDPIFANTIFNEQKNKLFNILLSNGDEYLQYINSMNQLLAIAVQLKNDVGSPAVNSHKYIAHQIALLFQCTSQCLSFTTAYSLSDLLSNGNLNQNKVMKYKDALSGFKRNIESQFQNIKTQLAESADSNNKVPLLSFSNKQWVIQLTTDILELFSSPDIVL